MDSVKNKTEQGTQTRRGRPYSLGVRVLALLLGVMVFCLASASLAYYSVNSAPVRNLFIAAPEYELEYHDNTGSLANAGNMPSPNPQRNYTGRFTVPTAEPTREGYRFKGWSLTADGTGERLAGGSAYTASALHTDLYAQWEEAEYSLLFNANGGSNPPETLKAEALGDSHVFTVPEHSGMTPPKAGKIFQGWALTAEAETAQYAAGDSVTVTAAMANRSLTLYAVWATEYILHFDNNSEALGGYGDVPDTMRALSTAKSHTFTIPAQTSDNTPKRDGVSGGLYEFGWWAADPDPEHYDAAQTVAYGSGYRVTEDAPEQTLYAFYNPRTPAKLVFYRNYDASDTTTLGSSAGTGTETLVQAQVTVANPSRSNYKFLGWAETQDATEAQYQRNDFVTINRIKENDKILYAVWQPLHRFSVNFVYNLDTHRNNENSVYRKVNGVWKPDWLFNGGVTAADGNRYASNWRFLSGWDEKTTILTGNWSWTSEPSCTWDAAFWQRNGLYAKHLSNKIADYEFLGWSTDPNDDEPMYTVDASGCIEQDIRLSCTDPNCVGGTEHQLVLFAVWRTTPKHYYRLVFASNDRDDTVVNSVTGEASPHPLTDYDHTSGGNEIHSMLSPWNYSSTYYYKANYYPGDIHDSGVSPVSEGVDSWTWTAAELNADGPLPSKPSTQTARYVLAGWTFKKWDTKIDVPVDENGKLLGDISIVHSDAHDKPTAVLDETTKKLTVYVPEHADSGEGCGHNLILYPVWRTVPLHVYNVIFTPSDGSSDGKYVNGTKQTLEFYDAARDTWVATSSGSHNQNISGWKQDLTGYYRYVYGHAYVYSTGTVDATVHEPPWDEDFWKSQALRVSVDSETTAYEFVGWSYEPNTDPAVRPPDIPVDENGFLTEGIPFDEYMDTQGLCENKTEGKTHNIMLYPVWRRSPLNTYKIVFCAEKPGSMAHPWVLQNGDWVRGGANGGRIIGTVVLPKSDGTVSMQTWNQNPPSYATGFVGGTSTQSSYTWDQDFWDANSVSVGDYYARRVVMSSDTTRYTFLGWSYASGGSTKDDVDVHVDENGIIQGSITLTDPDGLETGETYYLILYAVWQPETVHTYNLYFFANSGPGDIGDVYQWLNNAWRIVGNTYHNNLLNEKDGTQYSFRGPSFSSGELVADGSPYTWGAQDFWQQNGVYAVHGPVGATAWKFLGWSYAPGGISEADVDFRMDASGQYIIDDIAFEDPDNCAGGTHNLILFPVWKAVPNTRTYTLKFYGVNGMVGTPADMTQTESSDGTAWPAEPPSFTLPANPSWGERLFVGWAETSNASTGVYGYVDNTDAKTEDATRHLQGSISYPYGTNGQKTLYAVWWNSYRLHYDGNGAGAVIAGVPADQYSYWSVGSHTYDVSGSIPTREGHVFKGWATRANGAAQYGTTGTLNRQITLTANNGVADVTLYAVWEPASGTNSTAQPAAAKGVTPQQRFALPVETEPVPAAAEPKPMEEAQEPQEAENPKNPEEPKEAIPPDENE